MIEKLTIQNFQSHEQSELEFVPGVNNIVGGSDSGKSAVIRALRWAIQNRPRGDFFRSYWGGPTEVQIVFSNGQCVLRSKTDKSNEYVLSREGLKDQFFKAVKSDVPEEIKDALDLDEVNVQNQFDPHFLLGRSAGEVAQHFNRIAHLDSIDLGLRNINSWSRDIQNDITADEKAIERQEEELGQFSDLSIIEDKLSALEGIQAEQDTLEQHLGILSDINHELKDVLILIKEESELLKASDVVEEVLDCVSVIASLDMDADRIYRQLSAIDDITKNIKKAEKIIPAEKLVNSLIKTNGKLAVKNKTIEEMKATKSYLISIEDALIEADEKLNKLEVKFHKNMKGKCPLCGSKNK